MCAGESEDGITRKRIDEEGGRSLYRVYGVRVWSDCFAFFLPQTFGVWIAYGPPQSPSGPPTHSSSPTPLPGPSGCLREAQAGLPLASALEPAAPQPRESIHAVCLDHDLHWDLHGAHFAQIPGGIARVYHSSSSGISGSPIQQTVQPTTFIGRACCIHYWLAHVYSM